VRFRTEQYKKAFDGLTIEAKNRVAAYFICGRNAREAVKILGLPGGAAARPRHDLDRDLLAGGAIQRAMHRRARRPRCARSACTARPDAPRADDRRRPPAVARRARQSVPVRDRSGPGDAERDHRRQLRHRIAAALQPATLAVIVGERVPGIDERHDDVTAPGQEQHRLGRLRRRRVIEPQRHARRAPRLEGLRLSGRDLVTLLLIYQGLIQLLHLHLTLS